MDPPSALVPPPPPRAELRRRQGVVMVGLVATLAGLTFVSLELPVAATALRAVLPWIGAGALLFWIGGIFLGNALRPLWRIRPK